MSKEFQKLTCFQQKIYIAVKSEIDEKGKEDVIHRIYYRFQIDDKIQ